jgi:5,10-methylenetetrahydromethanopterin reductase
VKGAMICAWEHDPDRFLELAREGDSLGYSIIGVSDSIFRDTYVSLALVARETRRARIGPMVTNPVTRHPSVTANAISAVNDLSGGRAILGIGTGDSAVRSLQVRPATVDRLEQSVTAIKSLTRGTETAFDAAVLQHRWARGGVPVYVTAEGPRTLRMAGRVADGVVMHTASRPEIVVESVAAVHEGAREAGRDPAEVDVWVFIKLGIADTREEAVDGIKMSLAASVNHAFRHGLEGKHVPPEYIPAIRELIARYQTQAHVKADGANHSLTDELGLTDYLADRFGVVGTPEECVARIRSLGEVGVDGVIFGVFGRDPLGLVRRFGTEILPLI